MSAWTLLYIPFKKQGNLWPWNLVKVVQNMFDEKAQVKSYDLVIAVSYACSIPQGSYRSLKCLKVLEIHLCFFKALKSLKKSTFSIMVLQSPWISFFGGQILQSLKKPVNISVLWFYHEWKFSQSNGFASFQVMWCCVQIPFNDDIMVLEKNIIWCLKVLEKYLIFMSSFLYEPWYRSSMPHF